jgi:hypothetical protein
MMQGAIPWIMLGATIAAAITAYCNYKTAKAAKEAIMASNLFNCLNAYTRVMRTKTEALEQKSKRLCEDYYRELFDLLWTEFQLWKADMIPDHMMSAWSSVRYRSYKYPEELSFTAEDGGKWDTSYRKAWDDLEKSIYPDAFVDFMGRIHTKVFNRKEMEELRKEFKKKE